MPSEINSVCSQCLIVVTKERRPRQNHKETLRSWLESENIQVKATGAQ